MKRVPTAIYELSGDTPNKYLTKGYYILSKYLPIKIPNLSFTETHNRIDEAALFTASCYNSLNKFVFFFCSRIITNGYEVEKILFGLVKRYTIHNEVEFTGGKGNTKHIKHKGLNDFNFYNFCQTVKILLRYEEDKKEILSVIDLALKKETLENIANKRNN